MDNSGFGLGKGNWMGSSGGTIYQKGNMTEAGLGARSMTHLLCCLRQQNGRKLAN